MTTFFNSYKLSTSSNHRNHGEGTPQDGNTCHSAFTLYKASKGAVSQHILPYCLEHPLKLINCRRLNIWKYAELNQTREVQVELQIRIRKQPEQPRSRRQPRTQSQARVPDGKFTFMFKALSPVPPLLHTCSESRIEGQKRYFRIFKEYGFDSEDERSIYLNPSTDFLYVRFPNRFDAEMEVGKMNWDFYLYRALIGRPTHFPLDRNTYINKFANLLFSAQPLIDIQSPLELWVFKSNAKVALVSLHPHDRSKMHGSFLLIGDLGTKEGNSDEMSCMGKIGAKR